MRLHLECCKHLEIINKNLDECFDSETEKGKLIEMVDQGHSSIYSMRDKGKLLGYCAVSKHVNEITQTATLIIQALEGKYLLTSDSVAAFAGLGVNEECCSILMQTKQRALAVRMMQLGFWPIFTHQSGYLDMVMLIQNPKKVKNGRIEIIKNNDEPNEE